MVCWLLDGSSNFNMDELSQSVSNVVLQLDTNESLLWCLTVYALYFSMGLKDTEWSMGQWLHLSHPERTL